MDLKEKTSNTHRHPWELSRAQGILGLIQKRKLKRFADVGAGDGFFARKLLSLHPDVVYAADSEYGDEEACIAGVRCVNSIAKLSRESFDGLILMDVLEHIEDDAAFLQEALDKLVAGGTLLITVPAMQFLFSAHDRFLDHYRRYSRKRLLALLNRNGLAVERCHYFYASLLLFRLISLSKRVLPIPKREPTGVGMWRFSEKNLLTQCIVGFLNADFCISRMLGRRRVYLPGLSVVAVCRKKSSKA
ncbi:MAG: class I SAM-dependent methyltransferase [Prevotellaceae bacterium]|jgi:SAM-dependent methyltransferase|nr:class I SAM-dependent methyltransferase [Prevotellaceae bacterium]